MLESERWGGVGRASDAGARGKDVAGRTSMGPIGDVFSANFGFPSGIIR